MLENLRKSSTLKKVLIITGIMTGLIGFILLLYARSSVFVTDTCFHIKIGEWIVTNKIFPKFDSFSLLSSNLDLKFIAHEWLFGVIMYWVDNLFSLNGLIIVTILAVLGSYLYSIFKSGAKVPALIVSCLFLFFGFIKRIECRPDAFSAILLVIVGYVYLNETKKIKKYLIILLSILFMVNFHGGYATLTIIQLAWLFLCKSIVNKKIDKDDLILFISAILITCVNPYGFEVHKYALVATNGITEINSDYMPFSFSSLPQLGVVLVVATLSIVGYLKSKSNKILELLVMFMYLAMLLYYQRTINIFNYAFIIYMSKYLKWLFDKKKVAISCLIFVNVCSIFLSILTLSNKSLPNKTTEDFIVQDVIGKNIVKELDGNRYFNSIASGGFLIYLDKKPFIDGRNDVYTKEFGNPDLFLMSTKAAHSEPLMYNLTTKYDLSYLLLEKNSLTSQVFYASILWEVIDESNNFVLFKRVTK